MDDGMQCPNTPPEGKHLCDEHSGIRETDIAVFEAVTDHFKQDIREFFTRSNFYLAVQGALLSAVVIRKIPETTFEHIINTGIVIAGLSIVYFWWRVAEGSFFWINTWRQEVRFLSREISRFHSYDKMERIAQENPDKSPEGLTKVLPRLFALLWIVLWVAFNLPWVVSIIC